MQCFNQIQVINTNTFILWVSIHEYQKILFVIPILQDQDYDLDKTYLNQIANLKFIIKSSKSISRFHNMSYGIWRRMRDGKKMKNFTENPIKQVYCLGTI